MSLSKQQVSEYRRLKDSGVDVAKTNTIQFNEGSETSRHICAKSLAGLVGLQNGYRVDSEVPVTDRNDNTYYIDTLLWGHDSRLSYAVEAETSPDVETRDHKIAQYVEKTPVDDLLMVNVGMMPAHIVEAYGWIADELGLQDHV